MKRNNNKIFDTDEVLAIDDELVKEINRMFEKAFEDIEKSEENIKKQVKHVKKTYETPEFEFIEIGELDCIMSSNLLSGGGNEMMKKKI